MLLPKEEATCFRLICSYVCLSNRGGSNVCQLWACNTGLTSLVSFLSATLVTFQLPVSDVAKIQDKTLKGEMEASKKITNK